MEKCERPCYTCGFHKGPKDGKGLPLPVNKFYCENISGSDNPPKNYDSQKGKCFKYESVDAEFPLFILE